MWRTSVNNTSSLFICMVFATLEMLATTTWAAFQLQIRLASLRPRFGSDVMVYGLYTATAMYFLVWAQYSLTWSVSWRTLQSLGLIWTETPHIINGPNFIFYIVFSLVCFSLWWKGAITTQCNTTVCLFALLYHSNWSQFGCECKQKQKKTYVWVEPGLVFSVAGSYS